MMDSLEGYLDNISAAATQTVAKVGPLVELAASLAISVDTFARQQQEIKRLYEQINDLKKRWAAGRQRREIARGRTGGYDYMHTL